MKVKVIEQKLLQKVYSNRFKKQKKHKKTEMLL